MARRVASGSDFGGAGSLERTGSGMGAAGSRGSLDAGGSGACCAAEQEASGHSVLLMGVASDGRVWQWQLPLLSGTLPDAKPPALPPAPKPEMLGGCKLGNTAVVYRLRGYGSQGAACGLGRAWISKPSVPSTSRRPAAHAAPACDSVQHQPSPCAAAGGAGCCGTCRRSHSGRWADWTWAGRHASRVAQGWCPH